MRVCVRKEEEEDEEERGRQKVSETRRGLVAARSECEGYSITHLTFDLSSSPARSPKTKSHQLSARCLRLGRRHLESQSFRHTQIVGRCGSGAGYVDT